MSDTVQEICDFAERKYALSEVLHFKENPQQIRIIVYDITDPLFNTLANQQNRNEFKLIFRRLSAQKNLVISLVTRRIIIKNSRSKDMLQFLYGCGVKIYYNSRVHAKTIITIRKGEETVFITSSNLTHSGFNTNYEIGVLIKRSQGKFEKTKQYIDNIIKKSIPEDGSFYV